MKIILCAFTNSNLAIRNLASYLSMYGANVKILFFSEYQQIIENLGTLHNSDIDGVSFVTDELQQAIILAEEIRKNKTDRRPIIIFGGVQPTINPKGCLKYCDYVVRGEGEETILEIYNNIKEIKHIKNVSYLENEKLINNPIRKLETDLDKYPFPEYDKNESVINYMIMTSRGCPFSCTYCYNSYRRKMYKDKGPFVRKRSIDDIIAEFKYAKNKFANIKLIQIFDDNFITRSQEELRLFSLKYKKEIDIPFYCLGNPDLVNEQKIKILREAGLTQIQIGIQTGSEQINYNVYNRKIPNKTIKRCADICQKNSISVSYDIIFNKPYETIKDVKETLDLVINLPKPFKLNGHNLLFYPDSELTSHALKDGFIFLKDETETSFNEIQGNRNSPLWFNNDLTNTFFNINYSSKEKIRLNTLITLSQILPKNLIILLRTLPSNILLCTYLWLKLKKNRTEREEHFYNLIINKELRRRNRKRISR